MRKSDYLRKKRKPKSLYTIPRDLLGAVCKEWNKAGLMPDYYLDTNDDFCQDLPEVPFRGFFADGGIRKYYEKAQQFWEENGNGGVHPTENRWLNMNETLQVAEWFTRTIPYDFDRKFKVYFKNNKVIHFIFGNARWSRYFCKKVYVKFKHAGSTSRICNHLILQAHAFQIMNSIINPERRDGYRKYIADRQGGELIEVPKPKVTFPPCDYMEKWPVRRINGLYVCPKQLRPSRMSTFAIIAIILIFGGWALFMCFLAAEVPIMGLVLLVILLFFV